MRNTLLLLLFLLISASKLLSTELQQLPLDTFSYKYKFAIGDTLVYAVMSKDSIIINWGAPLLRIRFEKIMLTCDSITPLGHYVIKQQLIDFNSKESHLKDKNISRNSSAWLNVAAYIEMDSLGRRHKTYNEDNNGMIMAPGGPFQPFILFPLDTMRATLNRKQQKEPWIVTDTMMFMPESGIPNPVFRFTFFYRLIGMVDTLDLGELLKMTFSATSQSAVNVNNEEIQMLTTSINNAGGEIFWDTINWVPKYYFHTMEQRLTIEDKKNKSKEPGFHYIHSTYLLDRFVRKKQ